MTTTEKAILTSYFGLPDVEDCSSDAVPDGALSAEGKQKIRLPEVVSMTKVFFAKNRLLLYSHLRTCLRNGVLERTGRMTKSHAIDEYVRELSSAEAFSMSFNGKRWNAMVDRVNVYKDGRLVFRFAGGQEITVNIWD